ncbi:hypothetical protein CVT24_001850 [Panaeolus cyanescens]|uniref:ubiquitinyl hydrolase 1 n=1 Tax=Panaeolus cyanescens TaxID=181874 RepID=A0A409YEU2_9AGAR|nr:hypothetical protein CVT24_001850 [Panaeolus cyanescens]
MDVDQQLEQATSLQEEIQPQPLDLVGGPFAVIESDPGVFTSLTRKLGITGLELIELYDIEPWAVDHLNPYGLIFCFMWRKDSHRATDFNDPAAERVWFANQLSDDACATHAILNVVLNCPDVDIGEDLRSFRLETEAMSPVMKGLAITNSPFIRPIHNSFARPSDLRASLNNLTITTFEEEKRKEKEKKAAKKASKPPPAKRARITKAAKGKQKEDTSDKEDDEEEESYHFIGYVPSNGKVWELDGLKSGPLEVGELPGPSARAEEKVAIKWMDVVRPALRMKMEKYGGSGGDESNIRFSLLAIVDDTYQKASDELEFLKREKISLERRMGSGWEAQVDPSLLQSSKTVFHFPDRSSEPGKTFARDFGSRKMQRDLEIMKMSVDEAARTWEDCIQNAFKAKVGVEDELTKSIRSNTDHVKRTFDYEPFLREYVHSLHKEGLLNALLNRDDDGRKKRGRKKPTKG